MSSEHFRIIMDFLESQDPSITIECLKLKLISDNTPT